MKFSEVGPPITLNELDAWEQQTGHRIPDPYKLFLLRTNGGEPERQGLSWRRANGRREGEIVRRFCGLRDGQEDDLDYYVQLYVDDARVPHDLFPIASAECSNLLLMGGPGARFGQIFFWEHDFESEEGEPPTERNVHFIANSLDELLNKLEPLLSAL